MRIEIKRFGPVSNFVCDLDKDLVIVYGNNNIGKSYSMQVVYLLLKEFIANCYITDQQSKILTWIPYAMLDSSEIKLKKAVQDFLDSEKPWHNVKTVIEEEMYSCLGDIFLPEFINSCYNTFGNFDKALVENPVIRVNTGIYNFEIQLKQKKIKGTIDIKPVMLIRDNPDVIKLSENLDLEAGYIVLGLKKMTELLQGQIQRNIINCINEFKKKYSGVYFLPASRSGIYSGMSAFSSIVAELSKSRSYITKKIELPGISEPISDYFITLSNIQPEPNNGLAGFYTDIENNILKGRVSFDNGKKALMYRPVNVDADFGMTEVSSMVSEIAPVVAFLKFILKDHDGNGNKRKPILFIEEPEAHLHPENQIALIEVFTKLIQSDIKMVMSSHSNYIFNKLNNLVLGNNLDYNVYQPVILEEGQEGSIAKFIEINELGAEDENFIDVSEKLYYEREKIIQKLNMEE
ncbi:MAG: AAA family ATPase [Lachnospiraceae bacterium]|nr:AAA family ATPase [Lachnospiraceae bacterium]